MTDSEIEKDADECWALWRRTMREAGRDTHKFSEVDIWQHAYRCGVELGMELGVKDEREACAQAAERCGAASIGRTIRLRTVLLGAKVS